ncbi:MAG: GTP-binding protein [Planctomycetota bacterium]
MDRLRTFGIVAHIDAGKTTLTERILFDSGSQSWVGSVDEGTATMDFMPSERQRGISITSAVTRVGWGDHQLQIVDTPGHVDFIAEVERCLRVMDGVVVLVDAVRGVESQTQLVWQSAVREGLPRLVFVNKLDRVGADFDAVLAEVAEHFECRVVPLVVPLLDAKGAFAGLGDAITGAVQWFDGRPEHELVAGLQKQLREAHERVLETVADCDEAVLEAVVAGRSLSPDALRAALRAAFLRGELQPVLSGAALFNRGVDWLLDAVVALLPGAVAVAAAAAAARPRVGAWSVRGAGDEAAPFCGVVFKVQHLDQVWNYVRVVRGRLVAGCSVVRGNRPQAAASVVSELWSMHADRHDVVAAALPGEVVVVPGDLGWRTGDSLCDPAESTVLPFARFAPPVLAVTFEPERAEDAGALHRAVQELAIDDPTLRAAREHDRIVVRGMGELHLEIVAEMARGRAAVPFRVSRPRVDRRETVQRVAEGIAEIRAMVAGQECAARCELVIGPAASGRGVAGAVGAGVDAPAATVVVEPSASSACDHGAFVDEVTSAEVRRHLAAGFRVGPMHGADVVVRRIVWVGAEPSEALLEQAASKALENAVLAAGPLDLEPWVAFEVIAPAASSTAVLADLGARGAEVTSVAAGRLGARLTGRASLANMLGYVTKLRSASKGLGQVTIRPDGFAISTRVPEA